MKKSIRCAIYTRKSCEEGLEQEYNSLHAQRDAAENYIRSQKQEGWIILPQNYDDGGFSGGTLERPGLTALLEDIKQGKINTVVVYKVDRLSRSLTDFARLVDVFDAHNVSFVSVTQNFNTTSSMGRLTLNILLSFAQFEREVISERIRDKFAASKQKGLFMGGALPLGYTVENRKLVVIGEEAAQVRHIFKRFTQLKSITRLLKELDREGYRTKRFVSRTNTPHGGKKLTKQYLYRLLTNPLYIGKIVHRGKRHEGQHEGIISQELFEEVEALFAKNRQKKNVTQRSDHPALLRKLIRCGCCQCAMTPTSARKNRRVYRYYTPTTSMHRHAGACQVGPIAASEIESLVIGHIRQFIQSPEIICRTLRHLQNQERTLPDFGLEELRQDIGNFDGFWRKLTVLEQRRILEILVRQVVVHTDEVQIDLALEGFSTLIRKFTPKNSQKGDQNPCVH